MKTVTRREFLGTFRPNWLTGRVAGVSAIGAVTVFLLCQVYLFVRSQNPATFVRTLAFLMGVGFVIFVIRKLLSITQRMIEKTSDDFRVFAAGVMRFFDVIVGVIFGAYLYERWNAGADILSPILAFLLSTPLVFVGMEPTINVRVFPE